MPDPMQFVDVFTKVSLWSVLVAAFLGLLATITPATFALAPVVVGYVGAGARSTGAAWGRALAFLGGVTLVNVAIGALFGAAGSLAQELTGGNVALWNALAGFLTLLVALAALGVVRVRMPSFRAFAAYGSFASPDSPDSLDSLDAPNSPGKPPGKPWLGAFALGLPFGLVTCPTCVPLMMPLALGAATTQSTLYGALLFLAFAVGRGVPLLVLGGVAGVFKGLKGVSRHMPTVERVSALLLLATAFYFLYQAVWWMFWGMSMQGN